MTIQVDIDTHIRPLLEAVEWIGQASHKLSELEALAGALPEMQRHFRSICNPDPLNAAELMGQVAWVANNLLHIMEEVEGGAV